MVRPTEVRWTQGRRVKYAEVRERAYRVVIPAKIIRFLESAPTSAFAGTRDANLVPSGHRVSGWQADGSGRTLTAFVPLPLGEPIGRIVAGQRCDRGDHSKRSGPTRPISSRADISAIGRFSPPRSTIANRARERFVEGAARLRRAAGVPGESIHSCSESRRRHRSPRGLRADAWPWCRQPDRTVTRCGRRR